MALIIEFYPGKKSIFPSIKAPPVPPPTSSVIALPSNQSDPRDIKDSVAKKVTFAEWERRNAIIKRIAKECSFVVGQVLYPRNKEGLDLYGTCKVLGVCKTYHDFSEMEWPNDDVPLIIHAESMTRKTGNGYVRFNCTPAYLSEKNIHQ